MSHDYHLEIMGLEQEIEYLKNKLEVAQEAASQNVKKIKMMDLRIQELTQSKKNQRNELNRLYLENQIFKERR